MTTKRLREYTFHLCYSLAGTGEIVKVGTSEQDCFNRMTKTERRMITESLTRTTYRDLPSPVLKSVVTM